MKKEFEISDLREGEYYWIDPYTTNLKCLRVNIARNYAVFEKRPFVGSSIRIEIELTQAQLKNNIHI